MLNCSWITPQRKWIGQLYSLHPQHILSLSHYSLCYCPQTLLSTSVPLSVTLSFVIPPSSPPFQSEQLHGGSLRVKLFSADREDINQMMHIRQTSVREEGRNMFTHFLLIALCVPSFILPSSVHSSLRFWGCAGVSTYSMDCFSSLSLSQNLSSILLPLVYSNTHISLYFHTLNSVQVWNDMKMNKLRILGKLYFKTHQVRN